MGDMVHFDLVCCTDADRLICIDRRRIKKRNFELEQEVQCQAGDKEIRR